MSSDRLEESRRKVRQRIASLGEAADREITRAQRIKDVAIGLLGVVGVLIAAKRLSKSLGKERRKKEGAPAPGKRRPGR